MSNSQSNRTIYVTNILQKLTIIETSLSHIGFIEKVPNSYENVENHGSKIYMGSVLVKLKVPIK